jgi:hypothetical protein
MKLRYAWVTIAILVFLTGASMLLAWVVDPVAFAKVLGPKPPKGLRLVLTPQPIEQTTNVSRPNPKDLSIPKTRVFETKGGK